jgi:hypothetical protein
MPWLIDAEVNVEGKQVSLNVGFLAPFHPSVMSRRLEQVQIPQIWMKVVATWNNLLEKSPHVTREFS